MNAFKIALMAIRPKTLLIGAAPVLLSLAYLAHEGLPINGFLAGLTLFSCLLLQIASNLVNDEFDGKSGVDTTERLGPKRTSVLGLASGKQLRAGWISCLLVSLLLSIPLIQAAGLPILYLGLTCMLVAVAYTAGPFPLSHFGLGEILAFIFFGPVACLGTLYIQGYDPTTSTLILSFLPGLFSAALMLINNLRDVESDKLAKKKTLPLIIGDSPSVLLYLVFTLLPLSFYSLFFYKNSFAFIAFLVLYLLLLTRSKDLFSLNSRARLNNTLENTAKLCAFTTFYILIQTLLFSP